eukprot:1552840-Rhodomonas_salina.2
MVGREREGRGEREEGEGEEKRERARREGGPASSESSAVWRVWRSVSPKVKPTRSNAVPKDRRGIAAACLSRV